MYHGTKVLHWMKIKKDGLKAIGGGALEQGFYFTSSVPVGISYCFREKQQQCQDLKPVFTEVIIKDADKLTVEDYSKLLFSIKNVNVVHDNRVFLLHCIFVDCE